MMVASSACGVIEILTQTSTEDASSCEDKSDLTSPTSNQILDIDITVSVVYIFFTRAY